jgi:hypothetical protein
MRQFWTIRPNNGYGNGPKNQRINDIDWPEIAGAERAGYVYGDFRVAEEGAAPADHNHLVFGSIGIPSSESNDDHYHWFIQKPNGDIEQKYIGSGTPHEHPLQLQTDQNGLDYIQPKFYTVLVTCDEVEYQNLINFGFINIAERQGPGVLVEGEWKFDPVTNTVWGAGKQNAITNDLRNQLGIQLPNIVNSDRKFLIWVSDIGGWRPEFEDKKR